MWESLENRGFSHAGWLLLSLGRMVPEPPKVLSGLYIFRVFFGVFYM